MDKSYINVRLWKICNQVDNGIENRDEIYRIYDEVIELKNNKEYEARTDPLIITGMGEVLDTYKAFCDSNPNFMKG